MFAPFMEYAFIAGTAIALASGVIGYFLILRAQVFTADALSHVAFTGALGALAFGQDARAGLFVTTVAVALGMGAAGRAARPDDVVIGGVFAWVLGLGVLFLSIFATRRSGGSGSATVSVLFGSIFGMSRATALGAAVVGLLVCGATLVLARPLLFTSIDPMVAAARRLPVRVLGYAFLALVALTAAESTQVVGALLILGLMTTPAAAALRITARPFAGMALSAVLAVMAVWVGLVVSYFVPKVPPSFGILAVATLVYLIALVTRSRGSRHGGSGSGARSNRRRRVPWRPVQPRDTVPGCDPRGAQPSDCSAAAAERLFGRCRRAIVRPLPK